MNLVEIYLVEVHSIEDYESDWTKEKWAIGMEFLLVTATFDCYGSRSTTKRVYSKDEWELIVKRGYYLG